jgi:L-threonylcarbamoyladenylate synthase
MALRRTRVLVAARAVADDSSVVEAAAILRAGGLVAFPTETVYGLGALVRDERAVQGIFVAKGRPAAVPLIVHVRDREQSLRFVSAMSTEATVLAERFWPGPLTLVLARSARVPDAVTAGGSTVGVRAPAHPVALALIEALGDGIAAPSANRYGGLPPVRADHVMKALEGRIDAVLDGGLCTGGLESTVVDATVSPMSVLRRGAVGIEALAEHVRVVDRETPAPSTLSLGWLHVGDGGEIEKRLRARGAGERWAVLGFSAREWEGVDVRVMPREASAYGAGMYDALHEIADAGCSRVLVEGAPDELAWRPIRDRLLRLAATTAGR